MVDLEDPGPIVEDIFNAIDHPRNRKPHSQNQSANSMDIEAVREPVYRFASPDGELWDDEFAFANQVEICGHDGAGGA